jgi:hypothetical protein
MFLVSVDGKEFDIETHLARQCKTLADVIDVTGDEGGHLKIPVREISTPILEDIVTFLKFHASDPCPEFTPEDRYKSHSLCRNPLIIAESTKYRSGIRISC